jgi:hypothetical protein
MKKEKIMTFEEYKEKYKFNDYEKTSCIIYEMYVRAEKIEVKIFNTSDKFSLFFDVPRIKDINLYSSNDKIITLQSIIYNIYPDIYIDAIIWILQYRILEEINYIKEHLNEIDIYKYIKNFFNNYGEKVNPYLNKLDFDSKLLNETMNPKLIQIRNIINKRKIILEKKNIEKYEKDFENNYQKQIIKNIENIKNYSSNEFKELSKILNEKLTEMDLIDDFSKYKTNLNCVSKSIDNIISNIMSLNQEFKIYFNDNADSREINITGFNSVIKNHLKLFSFPLEYLKKEYLENKEKQFNRQIIENHYDGSYIRITKTYIEELIKSYLLNSRITPNFKRPIHELQNISQLSTLHNINLSLPLDELVEYIKELKKGYFKNLKINENSKYIITHLKKKINIKENLENLDDCIKILYIYDNKKKLKVDYILKELEIGKTKYYKLKSIADIYIDQKQYKKLYSM